MKKKYLYVILACLLLVMGAASLTTRVGSYSQLDTIADTSGLDTDPNAALGYTIGVPSDSIDLLKLGGGSDTYVNAVSLILHGTVALDGDTVTQVIYGLSDGGPRQRIASIVWTFGTAQVDGTATNLWAETAVVTSSHSATIGVEGADGDNRVGSVTFDVSGFRYLKSYFTAISQGGPASVTCLYRYF